MRKESKFKINLKNSEHNLFSDEVEYFYLMPKMLKTFFVFIALPSLIIVFTALMYFTPRFFEEFSVFSVFGIGLFVLAAIHKDGIDVKKRDIVFLFLTAFLLRTIVCYVYNLEPVSDFLTTYSRAERLANAPLEQWNSILGETYAEIFPGITPYILYETAIVKIFGEGYVSLQILNIIFSSFTCVFVAKITEGIFWDSDENKKRTISLCAGYLMAFNPVALFFISVLSCQHIATFLCFGALYFYICKPFKNIWGNIVTGSIFLAFSQLMRTEMAITVIAIICYGIYIFINLFFVKKQKSISAVFEIIIQLAVVLAVYYGILYAVDFILLKLNVVTNSIRTANLDYKLLVGLNYYTEGRYNTADGSLLYDGKNELIRSYLTERLKHPVSLIELFGKKIKYGYSNYYGGFYHNPNAEEGSVVYIIGTSVYKYLNNSYMYCMLISLLSSIFIWLRKHTLKSIFPFIFMTGFLSVFLLIEIQQRYMQILFPVYAIFASYSVVMVVDRIKCFFKADLSKN